MSRFGVSAISITMADTDAHAVSDFASSLGTEIKAIQKKSPVLENLTAQDIVTEALPARASGGPGSLQKAGAFEVDLPQRLQSIIAALRMHTMVACAGFSLRLRIR
jgi:hypothetical protein